jgi:purine-binding chemotaxis protein CheW
MAHVSHKGGDRADDEEQFVIFTLAQEEYGVPIEAVQEIVRVPELITRVPKTPAFVEGVINLRGAVMPIIDQRRRFALPHAEHNDRQRIVVFLVNGVRTGFIVDSVSEVLKVSRKEIAEAPELAADREGAVSRVANLVAAKRLILMLDPARLLSESELASLKRAA